MKSYQKFFLLGWGAVLLSCKGGSSPCQANDVECASPIQVNTNLSRLIRFPLKPEIQIVAIYTSRDLKGSEKITAEIVQPGLPPTQLRVVKETDLPLPLPDRIEGVVNWVALSTMDNVTALHPGTGQIIIRVPHCPGEDIVRSTNIEFY